MTELAPCTACKRHVAVGEITCPFCRAALPPLRAQRFLPRSITRAAIFSAAIAACSDPKPSAPVPATGSAAGSADDLEKLLDNDGTTVQRAAAVPADAAADATAIATAVDAGVPDAGVDPQLLAEKKREAERRRRERERQRQLELQRLQEVEEVLPDRIQAKPYGAPPARRRLV